MMEIVIRTEVLLLLLCGWLLAPETVGMRRENAVDGLFALLFVHVLGDQLTHRKFHILKVPQESVVEGLLGMVIEGIILLNKRLRATVLCAHIQFLQ